ncbi:MAG: hypothetical protein CMH54_00675 [Myxococcales bacterium]|nr:hypothetical protein [Myxococcales bacterium]
MTRFWKCQDQVESLAVAELQDGKARVQISDRSVDLEFWQRGEGVYDVWTGEGMQRFHVARDEAGQIWIHDGSSVFTLQGIDGTTRGRGDLEASGDVRSPMPAKVLDVLCVAGQTVEVGDVLVVVEAMKMEQRVRATVNGTVSMVGTEVGVQVDQDSLLVRIEPEEAE